MSKGIIGTIAAKDALLAEMAEYIDERNCGDKFCDHRMCKMGRRLIAKYEAQKPDAPKRS